jgi:hypothetical protein
MPISRAQLPEEFFDRTSAKLLKQPEPQYLYARLFLRALQIELAPPDTIGRPGQEISGQGAPYTAAEQDRLMLSGDLATEIFATKEKFDGEPGHVIKFNRPKFTNSTYTQASREIGPNQSISTTAIAAGSEQTMLQIKRFSGPYDQDNSRVAPYGLDAFDSTMGVHDLVKFVGTHLQRDFHRTVDSFWVTLSDLASTTVYPYGMTTANDATAKGMFPMSYEHHLARQQGAGRSESADARRRPPHPGRHADGQEAAQGRPAVRAVRRVPQGPESALPGLVRLDRRIPLLPVEHAHADGEQLEREHPLRARDRPRRLHGRHGRQGRVAPRER